MDKKIQAPLIEKYPSFFRGVGQSPRVTCMSGGITCGSGWCKLIERVCEEVTAICNNQVDFYFTQIKEKFGHLTIYWRSSEKYPSEINERLNEVTEKAWMDSAGVCEGCGTTENVTQNERGWIKSFCPSCRKNIHVL